MQAYVSADDPYGFGQPLDRTGLSTMKWEAEIERTGQADFLGFGTAEMDFVAAPAITRALTTVAEKGHFGYPYKSAAYQEAITGFFARRFGWTIERNWIASNVGIYPAMQPIIEELTEPDDEIIYQTPVHHIFEEVITSAGRVAVPNPLILRNGQYEMDLVQLRQVISPRTRLLMLCSPHNPVGRVWSRDELLALNEACLEHGIIVLADEVYCGLLFDHARFTPFASLSSAASLNTITLVSASKSFNITGLKHSLVIAENADLRTAYMRGLLRSNLNFGSSIFGMAATEAAFRDCDDWSAAVMRYVAGNFAHLQWRLAAEMPEIRLTQPEATYFAWADCRAMNLDAVGLRQFFDAEARVGLSYGALLGPGGEGHVRINLGTARATLDQGIDRIVGAWKKRNTEKG